MELLPWFERTIPAGSQADLFPGVVERVRGTPARLEDRVRGLPDELLTTRYGGRWSIQEHVGHLWDLEPVWEGRLDDFLTGVEELRPRDLENRTTHQAGHNTRLIKELLRMFRAARLATVVRIEGLPERVLTHEVMHPRLHEPINLVDLFLRVAEHDDHHLARIGQIMRNALVPRRKR